MDTRLTIRQTLFMFLFLSISSIFNYIPNLAVSNAGGTGYISVIYAGILLLIYVGLILQVLKVYPNKNLYDILQEMIGVWAAKAIIFLYAIWAYVFVLVKVGAYSVTLQATLMPSIHPGILIVILFLLVLYTMSKNERTIFRFSEFLYQPVIFFLAVIFMFALPNLEFQQLVPVSVSNLGDNLYTIPDICAIGGNLILVLFFCKHLVDKDNFNYMKKRLINSVLAFVVISGLAIVLSVGLNGTESTAKLSYPIFQAIKGVSILNSFERFDALMTMIAMMSDFVAVIVFLQVTMLCLGWVFNYRKGENTALLNSRASQSLNMNNSLKVYGIALFFIACVYILLRNITQYEFESFYRTFQIYFNLAFQYIIPVILGFVCIGKQWARHRREKKLSQGSEVAEQS